MTQCDKPAIVCCTWHNNDPLRAQQTVLFARLFTKHLAASGRASRSVDKVAMNTCPGLTVRSTTSGYACLLGLSSRRCGRLEVWVCSQPQNFDRSIHDHFVWFCTSLLIDFIHQDLQFCNNCVLGHWVTHPFSNRPYISLLLLLLLQTTYCHKWVICDMKQPSDWFSR